MSLLLCSIGHGEIRETISLAGEWRFQLDGEDVGVKEKWYSEKLVDTILLPGTTDEAKKGIRNTKRVDDRLSRPWKWVGAAWYQREVEIPEDWAGKRITLQMERTKDSRVWVDGKFCGWNDSLSAPHILDLSEVMLPGKRTLTILIDNSRVPPVAKSHAIDERTQTNWNGIIGTFELEASTPVWVEDIQVYPDVKNEQAKVKVVIGNQTGQVAKGELTFRGATANTPKIRKYGAERLEVTAAAPLTTLEYIWKPE
ncbi:MAG: sugar-binding domain-containing protein, partial [Opitutales bacterium]